MRPSAASPLVVAAKCSLVEMRAEVRRRLATTSTRLQRIQKERENALLRLELARLRQELADAGVDGEWRLELEHWRAAVAGLKKRVREQQERVAQREEEAEARALREREVSRQLVLEFRSGKAALVEASRRGAELARERAQVEASAEEAERRNATLRRSLEQQASMGPAGGGTAQLFVAALPALDGDALRRARAAVEAQLRQIEPPPPQQQRQHRR